MRRQDDMLHENIPLGMKEVSCNAVFDGQPKSKGTFNHRDLNDPG